MRIGLHGCIELEQRVVIGPCSDIKHEAVFWPQVLADSLEKPLMRVDFTIVAMLYPEAYVYSAAFQVVFGQAKVPCSHLKDMEQVAWHVIVFDILAHDIPQWPHFKTALAFVPLHKAFLLQDALI